MRRILILRTGSFILGMGLAIYAACGIAAQFMRPTFTKADFFRSDSRPSASEENSATTAAKISFDGNVLSDYAALKARKALQTQSNSTNLAATTDAQEAVESTLRKSPINSLAWLIFSVLKAKIGGETSSALKMSYFTGPLPANAIASRIRMVVTTSAIADDDIRLLAPADVRAIFVRHPALETEISATYRLASTPGKKFLLDTIQGVDPKFVTMLRDTP
jgi:hypothetical protein